MFQPIKGTNYVSVVIPFRRMPNVSSLLDMEDYEFALTHPESIFIGFLITIHANVKYPQYHNLRYDEVSKDHMAIFTEKGWCQCEFINIIDQLEREAMECLEYVRANGKEMLEKINGTKKN